MDQLSEFFQPVIDFILGNIGIVIFAIFVLSGLFGRGGKDKEQQPETSQAPDRQPRQAGEVDNRPLSERLAEAFGVEIPEEQARPRQQPQSHSQSQSQSQWPDPADRYGSEGRRSTTRRNVQDAYPDLFGGKSMFEQQEEAAEPTKWGFDETEWGTTFDRNDEQWASENQWGNESNWGNTFPERKSDEPYIDWPR